MRLRKCSIWHATICVQPPMRFLADPAATGPSNDPSMHQDGFPRARPTAALLIDDQDGPTITQNRMRARAFRSEAMAGQFASRARARHKAAKTPGLFELIAHVTAISVDAT